MYEKLVKSLRNCFGFDSATCNCEECEYNELSTEHDYSKCVDAMGIDAADAIEELQRENENLQNYLEVERDINGDLYHDMPRWIPVANRLPEVDGDYLCCLQNGCILIRQYYTFSSSYHPIGFSYVTDSGIRYKQNVNPVTHWMPLPETPKGLEYGGN